MAFSSRSLINPFKGVSIVKGYTFLKQTFPFLGNMSQVWERIGLELVSLNRSYRHTAAPSKMVRPFVLKTRNARETKYNKK